MSHTYKVWIFMYSLCAGFRSSALSTCFSINQKINQIKYLTSNFAFVARRHQCVPGHRLAFYFQAREHLLVNWPQNVHWIAFLTRFQENLVCIEFLPEVSFYLIQYQGLMY